MDGENSGLIIGDSILPDIFTVKYCQDLGIEERSPHKERKTFTSALLSNGVSINTTRQLAGHVDERTTLNNYCFDRSEDDEKLTQITYALSS
jgi:integrase